jgi:hypothetical protein
LTGWEAEARPVSVNARRLEDEQVLTPSREGAFVPPNAPPDIWERLARLNATYDVSIQSLKLADALGAAMHWEITIKQRGKDDGAPMIYILRRSLLETILCALEEVDARPWP